MEFDLERFIKAQKEYYDIALEEIRNGEKRSHWMWFIFPQIKGLGETDISIYYAIENLEEAKAYLKNEYLSHNLIEITNAILEVNDKTAVEILGFPDYYKLRSSMTLFYLASTNGLFKKVIDKYYNGELGDLTMNILEEKGDI